MKNPTNISVQSKTYPEYYLNFDEEGLFNVVKPPRKGKKISTISEDQSSVEENIAKMVEEGLDNTYLLMNVREWCKMYFENLTYEETMEQEFGVTFE